MFFQLHLNYTICIQLIFKKRDFWHFWENTCVFYFVRFFFFWISCWTNIRFIKVRILVVPYEVASFDSLTCTKRRSPSNKNHIIFESGKRIYQMCESKDKNINMMAKRMRKIYDKYLENLSGLNMLLLIAVVFDPRYKMEYANWSINQSF